MVNVISKRCIHENCNKRPTFNNFGKTTAEYCFSHKLENMVDVINKKCIHENCNKQPAFNNYGETIAEYCFIHKLENMVNVKSKRCIYENCDKLPAFNNYGETTADYCFTHKLENMVNVKSKRCIHENCDKIPNFNNFGETTAEYCFTHKLKNMVNVKAKRCIYKNCNKQPNFNFLGKTVAEYCFTHKLENMIDIHHKTCLHDWCNTRVNNKNYDGYCLRCFIYTFPDKPVSRNYKTKEFTVADFIKEQFPTYTWRADKTVLDGCSRRRPDLLLDLGECIIIIEVDENQHTDYDCSCENRRIMEISKDAGHRAIVFIRFNPDEYTSKGKKITSCWGANGNGICAVKKTKAKEWDGRLTALKEQVDYWIEHRSDKMVETIQLYYDDEDGTDGDI
jgi:hypothetical protein